MVADGRFALFYDGARIERGAGDLVTIRTRRQSAAAPETQPHAVSRIEIQCLGRMVRVVETVTRDPNGSIVHTDSVPQPFEVDPRRKHRRDDPSQRLLTRQKRIPPPPAAREPAPPPPVISLARPVSPQALPRPARQQGAST